MKQAARMLVTIAGTALILVGCATSTNTDSSTSPNASSASSGADTKDVAKGGVKVSSDGKPTETLVHFAYDSSNIDRSAAKIIEAHAGYLARHPNLKIRLEGHADERGTRSYNMGLGERRAQAVGRALRAVANSAGKSMEVVSYGEEKPLAAAHDEKAWAQNRRVQIIYQ